MAACHWHSLGDLEQIFSKSTNKTRVHHCIGSGDSSHLIVILPRLAKFVTLHLDLTSHLKYNVLLD
jgi:hypothetical protein